MIQVLISSCRGKQTNLIRYRRGIILIHAAWKPHFAANSIMQTCRLPTISSKQFACFIQCNYYIFCLSIQTGRLERQVSLQDNNCLGQFGFSKHERYTVQYKPHPNKQKTFFICNFLTVNYIITPIYLLKYQR